MRHLLKTKFEVNRFATLKQIIKRKSKQIKTYEKMHGIEFEKHLKNLMIGQRADLLKTNKIANSYEKICLTAGKPIETILKQFVDHSKKYSEEDLVNTAVYLGKAYQMSLIDHGGHLDRFDYKLIKSPMFDHFIEEVKYALSDKAYISTKNVVKVLEGLSQLNYIDYEIVKLVTIKVQKFLEIRKQQKVKFEPRLYQSEKKDYYKSNLIGFSDALVKNKKFNKNLEYFKAKKKEFSVKQPLKSLDKSIVESSDAYEDLVNILSEYSKMNKSVDKLVEAVLAVRRQYSKLVTISKNQKVIRNPQLNNAALLVEQKLIEMHLITIEDVQKPERIPIDPNEIQKVQGIVQILMSEANVQNFEDYIVDERYNLEYISQNRQKDLLEYSSLLESFAKYVNIPYRLYGTEDGMSLLNIKWQRYFIGEDFKQNNLQVQRGFRKAFLQTQLFFNRHFNEFDLSFMQASLKSKIRWYSTMIEMGFIQEIHNYFKQMKFVGDMLKSLDEKETFMLTKILNNACQAEHKLDPQVHQWIQKRVEEIIDKGTYLMSLNELTDTINYLYQASSTKKCELNQSLYSTLIQLLALEVNYVEQSPISNKVAVRQAKRILMFESLQTTPYTGGFQSLSQSQNPSDPRCSPFIKALYQTLNSSLNSANTPFVMTGINENNEPCGVYIANSDCSSFSGDMSYGNINAFCQRLWKKYQVRVSSIGINKLLSINYPTKFNDVTSRNVSIGLKTSDEILLAFAPYLSRNNLALTEFIKTLTSILVSSNSVVTPSALAPNKARKLLHSMKKLLALSNNQKQIFLMNQFYAKRCQMLLQFHKFKKQIDLILSQQDRDKIQNMLTIRSKKDQKVKLSQLISNVEKELEKNFNHIQEAFKKIQQSSKNSKQIDFKGKRISLNLLQPSSQSAKIQNPSQILLSTPYLLDTRYIEYKDWQSLLKNALNYSQISLQSASDTTKLLARKFCPNARDTLVALPETQGEIVVPHYPINWESKYRNYMDNREEKEQLEAIAQSYRSIYKNRSKNSQQQNSNLKYTTALLNFKHELKANKSSEQILKFLTSFQFIDNLLTSKLSQPSGEQPKSDKSAVFVTRDSESYFSYLQHKSDKTYLQSPYLRYIFSKLEQSDQLKSAMEQHKSEKSKLFQEYQTGELDRKHFLTKMKKLDNKLVEQAKKLRNKSLTRTQGNRPQMLEDGSKIVQLNKDIESIERVINSNSTWYDRDEDSDLVIAAGNYDKALEIKRARAETNFILFKILSQKCSGQQLSQPQKKFLLAWRSSITNPSESTLNKSFTKLSLSALSKADHQSLITASNLSKHCPNLALSDVILELSHFFDQAVIQKLEAQIISEQVIKKYNIPQSVNIFSSSSTNKIVRKFNYEMQDNIFDQQAQLKQKDIETIINMSKIFKTQALSDREKYNLHYGNLRKDIDTMNQCSFRTPLISEYLKQKDNQYFSGLYPADAYALKKQSTDKLWFSIFDKPAAETSASQLRSKISQLCRMMLVFKSDMPPYFSSLVLQILQHENTDIYSKQKLIAYLELFKINIQLDSQELLDLATQTKRNKEEVLKDIKKWCNQDVRLRLFDKNSDLVV